MNPFLYFLSSNWLPPFLPNQVFFLSSRSGMLVANRLMDPSSVATNAMLGIGVGEFPDPSPVIVCTSTRTTISRRFKTDAFPTEDRQLHQKQNKKKRKRMCVCVWKYRKLGYGSAATTYWMMKKCSGADCYNVLSWSCFSPKARRVLTY